MVTLWQQQDGGYMLIWKRYVNNKMAAIRFLHLQQYSHRLNLLYFFCSWPAILQKPTAAPIQIIRGFPQLLEARDARLSLAGPRPLPLTSLPIHVSQTVPLYDVLFANCLAALSVCLYRSSKSVPAVSDTTISSPWHVLEVPELPRNMQPEPLDYNLLVKLVTDLSFDIKPKSWCKYE